MAQTDLGEAEHAKEGSRGAPLPRGEGGRVVVNHPTKCVVPLTVRCTGAAGQWKSVLAATLQPQSRDVQTLAALELCGVAASRTDRDPTRARFRSQPEIAIFFSVESRALLTVGIRKTRPIVSPTSRRVLGALTKDGDPPQCVSSETEVDVLGPLPTTVPTAKRAPRALQGQNEHCPPASSLSGTSGPQTAWVLCWSPASSCRRKTDGRISSPPAV